MSKKEFADIFLGVKADAEKWLLPGTSTKMTERGIAQHVFEVEGIAGTTLAQFSDAQLLNHCDRGGIHFGGRVERAGNRATVWVYVD